MKTKLILQVLVCLSLLPTLSAAERDPIDKYKLSPSLKYIDQNDDDLISLKEAVLIFELYFANQSKIIAPDLVIDVESTVIDVIAYLEGTNCDDIKKTKAAKRFIEIYYATKFIDTEEKAFGILPNNLKVDAKEQKSEISSNESKSEMQPEPYEYPESIVTDRPDQTEAPSITPKGFFQVEVGAQSEFDNDKINNVHTQSTLYNTTLWKYGVTKNFELRLITEYGSDKISFQNNPDIRDTVITTKGLNPVSIGTKIALQKEHGIIPEICLLTHLELPYFGATDFRPNYVVPRFRFLFAHTLSERFTFSYNLGVEWEDGTNASTGIYTASLGAALLDNLSMFVEAYGFLKENSTADNRLDAGFTFLLSNDFQFDCSGGIGLNDISPDYFISAGLSIRFNAFNKEVRKLKKLNHK